ncbi:metallophosphoesterase [Hydrocarboniphaga effusa]|uniref:metallophosphoesterase n=1 Tax=Hydrocarboniphaga effusa TaxID=243629 RepID=UPI003BAB21DC
MDVPEDAAERAVTMSGLCFQRNTTGRDFVVGDLHGQSAMFDALLRAVSFDRSKDRIFSLGDIIDRGTGSEELLVRFSTEPGFFAIRGNHEQMLIEADDNLGNFKMWQTYGGNWALSLSLSRRLELADLAKRLPLAASLELADGRKVGLVHAEVPPGTSWSDAFAAAATPEDQRDADATRIAASLLWGRQRYSALEAKVRDPEGKAVSASRRSDIDLASQPVAGVELVLCGHNIVEGHKPKLLGNTLFLDTGSFEKRGRLTMYEPATRAYWQCRWVSRVPTVSRAMLPATP